MTGAEMLLKLLINEGVEVIFGYPGGAVLPIYDALMRVNLRHVLARHEQGAIHAAQGYARATGKVGVVLATSGPGATNLVTGLVDAKMDSTPLVAITGQVARSMLGKEAFQEAPTTEITKVITKKNYLVESIADLEHIVAEAFCLAQEGRPGPVLIDIPKDVAAEIYSGTLQRKRTLRHVSSVDEQALQRAAVAINGAKHPLFLVGGGLIAAGASRIFHDVVRKSDVPVVSTLLGLGAFPASDPHFFGMVGMHGEYAANMAISESDCLISLGARLDDRVTGRVTGFAPKADIIHFDIEPKQFGKNVETKIAVQGDLQRTLEELLPLLHEQKRTSWLDELQEMRRLHPLAYKPSESGISPQWVVQKLHEWTHGQAIVTTDVGQHQMWAAQYYAFNEPRRFITSGGLGTMGFGLPAAIGATIGRPDLMTLLISGDGSILMNIQELVTIVQERLPVKIVVLNNLYLGMVRQWQQLFYEGRYAHSHLQEPNLARIAAGFGLPTWQVHEADQFLKALPDFLQSDGPAFLDVQVAPLEDVYPMVPAGAALSEMVGIDGYKEEPISTEVG